ncbi:hypothetical protein [Mycolicibacterium gilvum]
MDSNFTGAITGSRFIGAALARSDGTIVSVSSCKDLTFIKSSVAAAA